jgi:glycolate oxidase iron-sulfur subunit
MPEAVPRPPDPPARATDTLVALADQCVQCGLCLPACPTYSLERIEAESPRGRIALARAWALELVPSTPAGDAHLDKCLGCRRCEAVCPAGVRYGPLLVEARARQRTRRAPGWRQRIMEQLVQRPGLLRSLLAAYRVAWPLLPSGLRPLPRPPARPRPRHGQAPGRQPPAPPRSASGSLAALGTSAAAHGTARAIGGARPLPDLPPGLPPDAPLDGPRAVLFVGCVAGSYEASLRAAVARLCAAAGVAVATPAGQGCCGALHAHAGDIATAQRLAAANAAAFAEHPQVLTLASGCHESVASALPAGSVADALTFLATRAGDLHFRETRECVALHLPCTQRNVVRSDAATRALLARVPGLAVVELDADPATRGFGCCGAAGSTMLDDPARAAAFRAPLLAQLQASGATRLLSANIGCRLHLAGGTALPVQHPLEFLARCLEPTPSPSSRA